MNPDHNMTVPSGSSALLDLESSAPGSERPRVWLVDDNLAFRSVLAELLADVSGFDCSREFSSTAAVLAALAREAPPEVILLDNQMPGGDGVDAVRPIKLLASSTRVLMLTTCFDSLLRHRVLRDGAADFLQKSYSVEQIAERIQAALDKPEGVAAVRPGGSVQESCVPEKNGRGQFGQRDSCNSDPLTRQRAAWADASGRLVRGMFQVRSWLNLFF